MKKHYDKILFDMNSLGYAAHSARELRLSDGSQIQAVFFTLKMVKRAIDEYAGPETKCIGLWDSKAQWRYDIHPEYKGKRDDDPVKKASRGEYKRQVPIIRKMFALVGLEQRFAQGEEADDLGAALVHNRAPGEKILVVTGDHDWLQLVSDDVDWYDPRELGKHVNAGNFTEVTKCANVVVFAQTKAILGDSSDNVKGVAGIGDKSCPLMFEQWGSIANFFKWTATKTEIVKGDVDSRLNRYMKALNQFAYGPGKAQFIRNMNLMNLLSKRHRGTEILDKQVILPAKQDMEEFNLMCHEYAFMTIIKSLPVWQKTFAQGV
ncbi:5'-3' exonuclease [Pseudomonas phage hairong]|nr:5'-3' exonuclease [Pseudomonas phage hairong]